MELNKEKYDFTKRMEGLCLFPEKTAAWCILERLRRLLGRIFTALVLGREAQVRRRIRIHFGDRFLEKFAVKGTCSPIEKETDDAKNMKKTSAYGPAIGGRKCLKCMV